MFKVHTIAAFQFNYIVIFETGISLNNKTDIVPRILHAEACRPKLKNNADLLIYKAKDYVSVYLQSSGPGGLVLIDKVKFYARNLRTMQVHKYKPKDYANAFSKTF